jgi:tetratricopeptide (TPR) repeat protein
LGNHQKALSDYTESIKLNPQLAEAFHNRGLTYYQLGQRSQAVKELQQAAELFSSQGKKDNAQKSINALRILEENPD